MPGAQSRTPIDPALVHDPARIARDVALLYEIVGLVPIDTAQRCLREASRRMRNDDLREFARHPLRVLRGLFVELPLWLLYAFIHAERPRRALPPPPSDLAFVRRQVAHTWTQALYSTVDHTGRHIPLPLPDTMFPPLFEQFRRFGAWSGVLVPQTEELLDEQAATELLEAFAVQVRARIDAAPGQCLDLPGGLRVMRCGEGYVAVSSE